MPKQKITRGFLTRNFVVINVPEPCERLFHEPQYYCTRVEGWAFDVQCEYCKKYDVNIAFVHGYAGLGKLQVRRQIVEIFEKRIRKNAETNWSYKHKQTFAKKQLEKFVEVAYYNAVVKGKRGK